MCPERDGPDGEYPAPSGPQRAPQSSPFNRTCDPRDNRQSAAMVEQVIGLGHITLSRAKMPSMGFYTQG
jgi:hypothetical protein